MLEHAVDAERRGLKVYESLRSLSEVIGTEFGTEYGDRVLYELIQNAHDAHRPGDNGRIATKLVVRSETEGTLYIANGGSGFRAKDVDAIRNLATSADAGYRDKGAMERQNALGRMILPGEVADGIHFLCSDAARAISGISMPIDGGWLSRVTYVQHPGWPPKDWDPE